MENEKRVGPFAVSVDVSSIPTGEAAEGQAREGQLDDLSEARQLLTTVAEVMPESPVLESVREFLARVGEPATPQERHRRLEEQSKHNGYRTRETWLVCLWIDNDEAAQLDALDRARQAWAEAEGDETFTRRQVATFALADNLRDWIEEERSNGGWAPDGIWKGSLYSDLTRGALDAADWHEVAEGYMEQLAEGDELDGWEA